ncbi:MAG: type II toxin-antitoxin system PemK/MazF family toxin [Candidatus Eremiobacterota bacterium]
MVRGRRPPSGSEQSGVRPCVVVSHDSFNQASTGPA